VQGRAVGHDRFAGGKSDLRTLEGDVNNGHAAVHVVSHADTACASGDTAILGAGSGALVADRFVLIHGMTHSKDGRL
jgi:hypothetical protein